MKSIGETGAGCNTFWDTCLCSEMLRRNMFLLFSKLSTQFIFHFKQKNDTYIDRFTCNNWTLNAGHRLLQPIPSTRLVVTFQGQVLASFDIAKI